MNPMRAMSHPDGAEVVFSVRQLDPDDAAFERDCAMVAADLDRLAALVETESPDAAPSRG